MVRSWNKGPDRPFDEFGLDELLLCEEDEGGWLVVGVVVEEEEEG